MNAEIVEQMVLNMMVAGLPESLKSDALEFLTDPEKLQALENKLSIKSSFMMGFYAGVKATNNRRFRARDARKRAREARRKAEGETDD